FILMGQARRYRVAKGHNALIDETTNVVISLMHPRAIRHLAHRFLTIRIALELHGLAMIGNQLPDEPIGINFIINDMTITGRGANEITQRVVTAFDPLRSLQLSHYAAKRVVFKLDFDVRVDCLREVANGVERKFVLLAVRATLPDYPMERVALDGNC